MDPSATLQGLDDALDGVESRLAPLLSKSAAELRASLSPIESARLDSALAYSINSLFWVYLAAQGVDPTEHPVKAELARIKERMMKVESMARGGASVGAGNGSDGAQEAGGTSGRRLNKGVAKRIVDAALAESVRPESPKKARTAGEGEGDGEKFGAAKAKKKKKSAKKKDSKRKRKHDPDA